jgi:hypothetical protein
LFIDVLLCPGSLQRFDRQSMQLVQSQSSASVSREPDSESTYTALAVF